MKAEDHVRYIGEKTLSHRHENQYTFSVAPGAVGTVSGEVFDIDTYSPTGRFFVLFPVDHDVVSTIRLSLDQFQLESCPS